MSECKRKFKRFDVQLGVKFRPTYGAKDYSPGVTKDLSCEGLALDAHDFRFIIFENLELLVDIPGSGVPASLFGDIVWKKQNEKRCLAGIKFRMKDKNMQEEAVQRILSCTGIPGENMYRKDPDHYFHKNTENIPLPVNAGPINGLKEPPNKLGLIKQYYENGRKCKVTFRLLRELAGDTQNVTIVGDFNNWNNNILPMTQLKNGDFVITIDLYSKREYRFRYLIDGDRWENDWYADRFLPNELGFKDSVVIV